MSPTHGEYQVVGTREYRGHKPGERFEALLAPRVEQRAIARGDIKLLRRVTPSINPGSFRLPDGWLPQPADSKTIEAPTGASFIEGGG
jgi:hypothetical protein